ncbi:MAG: peptidyl-prolyl cis-trans isomerase [Deltaproteobacteria bacterium]|nr:peptidyl-prolyl cis-trans isomerase [Deltaproteobacteria bacterium]
MMRPIVKFFREPLVHFIALGLLIFCLNAWLGNPGSDSNPVIEVSAPKIKRFSEIYQAKWRRVPTSEEMNALIEQYVREEILYREAVAMGLDQNDTIVRRRLAQKVEFLSEDLAPVPDPDDAELQRFLEKNALRYRKPTRISFTHIYFSRARRGVDTERSTHSVLDALNRQSNPPARAPGLGDPFMLQHDYALRGQQEITELFGKSFASSVMQLPPGSWQGPVASSYGLHLVRVSERQDARDPSFDEVRAVVLSDFKQARRQEINQAFYKRLRDRYRVVIDPEVFTADRPQALAEVSP